MWSLVPVKCCFRFLKNRTLFPNVLYVSHQDSFTNITDILFSLKKHPYCRWRRIRIILRLITNHAYLLYSEVDHDSSSSSSKLITSICSLHITVCMIANDGNLDAKMLQSLRLSLHSVFLFILSIVMISSFINDSDRMGL